MTLCHFAPKTMQGTFRHNPELERTTPGHASKRRTTDPLCRWRSVEAVDPKNMRRKTSDSPSDGLLLTLEQHPCPIELPSQLADARERDAPSAGDNARAFAR